jgi:hypothetical protein
MSIVGYNYFNDQDILENPYVKAAYAIVCFFAWLKLFYLMRIFQSFAYFTTIIYEIIKELKVFVCMLLILMFAFTNFFYVIDDNEHIVERYWESSGGSNSIINSLITTYLIGLGEFSFDGFE